MHNASRKRRSFFPYLNPKNIVTEVHRYGYHFSVSSYIKFLLAAVIATGLVGYAFELQLPYILGLIGLCLFLLPGMILTTYHYLYEQKRFMDISNYMEQLLYSFKRRSKILSALIDTLALFPEGELHQAIVKAIYDIQNGENTVYEKAFSDIEMCGCKRVETVHRFLINVERVGGSYEESADILLEDRNRWVDRTYASQKERQRIQRNMTIAIVLSFLIVGSTVWLLPKDFMDVLQNPASQLATTAVIAVNVLLWAYVHKKLAGEWMLEDQQVSFQSMKRYYGRVMKRTLEKEQRSAIVLAVTCFVIALLCYFFTRNVFYTLLLSMLSYLLWMHPKYKYRTARKRLTREVEKIFPEWMMSMALVLQTENVHVALARTTEQAPELLREELERLMQGLEREPNSIKPYLHFFEPLDIPDIASAMKMLYSMAEYGSGGAGKQIAALVKRNSMLMDKAESMKQEDYLAGMGFFILLPMVTGSAKMLVDMVLLIMNLLSFTKTI